MRTTIALVMALAASSLAFAEESQRWKQDDGANDLVIHIPWCRGALRDARAAIAATAAAKARLEQIQEHLNPGLIDYPPVREVLESETIVRLRNQYLDYAAREEIYAHHYGADHPATIHLRALMQEVRRKIDDETKMIAASAEDDYETALAREKCLDAEVEQCLK